MARVTIATATPDDIDELIANLRPADREEAEAYGLPDWQNALRAGAAQSILLWAARDDDGLVAVFGVTSIDERRGSPWMMATPAFDRHHRDLVREVPPYLERMLAVFPNLSNFVFAGNETSIRWLKRIGFHVEPAEPCGALGKLFHPFHLEASHV